LRTEIGDEKGTALKKSNLEKNRQPFRSRTAELATPFQRRGVRDKTEDVEKKPLSSSQFQNTKDSGEKKKGVARGGEDAKEMGGDRKNSRMKPFR